MTEVWIRNPVTCIRECAELMVPRLVWDRGYLRKMKIDPQRHVELHYASVVDYRLLLVGEQGAAELRRGHSLKAPAAVYPVWQYGKQMIPELEKLMANQLIQESAFADVRGVPGQEHRVVLIDLPPMRSPPGRALIGTLLELKNDHPNCKLHIHGLYGWKEMFAHGWAAIDFDPVEYAKRGKVQLGSGKRMEWEKASGYSQWVSLVGFTVGQLTSPQERTKFNIQSAQWAGENFREATRFRARDNGAPVDWKSPDSDFKAPQTTHVRAPRAKKQEGDKLLCDKCSLAPACKFYRQGGVCVISDSDGASLARHFGTRDADQIIEGLGQVLVKQTKRFETGVDQEEATGALDGEVTKIGNSVFTMGVKLAKLLDPSLNQPGVQVNVGIHSGQQRQMHQLENTPAQLMAQLVRELSEDHGIPLAAITPVMIAEYLVSKNSKTIHELTAIEARAS